MPIPKKLLSDGAVRDIETARRLFGPKKEGVVLNTTFIRDYPDFVPGSRTRVAGGKGGDGVEAKKDEKAGW